VRDREPGRVVSAITIIPVRNGLPLLGSALHRLA
jgi:hypothetical protein